MPVRRRAAALLAVLAVGIAPAAALAQSGGAGDDQYVDPIGGNSHQHSGGTSNGSGGSGTSTGPALSATPALSAASSQAAPAAPVASSAQTLPRTGLDTGAVAAIGLALLLAGAALRLRLRDDRH